MKCIIFLLIGLAVGAGTVYYIYVYDSFPADGHGAWEEPHLIDAKTANNYFKKYHNRRFGKLKTSTEAGVKDIKTFIVRKSIIDHFDSLVQSEANAGRGSIKGAGLALTLGQNDFGSTLIVSALICDADADPNTIANTRHLLPGDETSLGYLYDHIDLCPHTCPVNSFATGRDDYYSTNPRRKPDYDPDYNYWVRQ